MPVASPFTIPDVEPIVAMSGEPEVHVPPVTASVNVVVVATHKTLAPAMGAGAANTVTGTVDAQPLSGIV